MLNASQSSVELYVKVVSSGGQCDSKVSSRNPRPDRSAQKRPPGAARHQSTHIHTHTAVKNLKTRALSHRRPVI